MCFTFVTATDLVLRLLPLLLWLRPLPELHVRVVAAPLRRHRDAGHPLDRGPIAAVVVVLSLEAKSLLYLSFLDDDTKTAFVFVSFVIALLCALALPFPLTLAQSTLSYGVAGSTATQPPIISLR